MNYFSLAEDTLSPKSPHSKIKHTRDDSSLENYHKFNVSFIIKSRLYNLVDVSPHNKVQISIKFIILSKNNKTSNLLNNHKKITI